MLSRFKRWWMSVLFGHCPRCASNSWWYTQYDLDFRQCQKCGLVER